MLYVILTLSILGNIVLWRYAQNLKNLLTIRNRQDTLNFVNRNKVR